VARNNLIVAPSYTRVDLASFAELVGPRLAIGVVAENVANTRYVTSGAGAVLFAGRPRRIALQLTSAF
jgi:outer membrane receptor protein involved in Fe transport